MSNVDHIADIAVGVVVVVALLFLSTIGVTLAPKRPLLIAHVAALVKILRHRLVFQLDGGRHGWWSLGRVLLDGGFDFSDRRGSSFHVVGEVLVVVIGVVVVEVEALHRIII